MSFKCYMVCNMRGEFIYSLFGVLMFGSLHIVIICFGYDMLVGEILAHRELYVF